MKVPQKPPVLLDFPSDLPIDDLLRLAEVATRVSPSEKYLHWDELRRREPPQGLNHREWWLAVKLGRRYSARPLPLTDAAGQPFTYSFPDEALENLHKITQQASGRIGVGERVVSAAGRDQYVVSSLMEEAITSSQLEGAATTRRVAKEMIRSGRPPRDKDERMILNNYQALNYIRERQGEQLTPALIRDLHRMVTDGTLGEPGDAGRVQLAGEDRVSVFDPSDGTLLHTPPPAEQLPERLEALCRFANGEEVAGFLDPVLRAIIVHFWLSYDHPFVDGNGRTARALFYWSMLSQGYWLTEYLTISRLLRKAPTQYARSFLYTETDERDLTYFILYQLQIFVRAIEELDQYLQRKTSEAQGIERLIGRSPQLNHRQRALLSDALQHPDASYTVRAHANSHGVVLQTARTDLHELEGRGFLERRKEGKAAIFSPPVDLADKLRVLGRR